MRAIVEQIGDTSVQSVNALAARRFTLEVIRTGGDPLTKCAEAAILDGLVHYMFIVPLNPSNMANRSKRHTYICKLIASTNRNALQTIRQTMNTPRNDERFLQNISLWTRVG